MSMLILNSGSSSIKFQVRDITGKQLKCKGLIECIGDDLAAIHIKGDGLADFDKNMNIPDHTIGLKELFKLLVSPEVQVINTIEDIRAVGHRVVHGGEEYSASVLVDDKVIATIDKLSELAPLHNPANLKGILACRDLLPGVPQVAVFDTAFHQTMPEYAYMYPLPRKLYEDYKIRRYGFHGTSHRYVCRRAMALTGLQDKPSKIITAHLGNGCSITAIENGKSIETSMGFTPVGGLTMGTRPGEIDASLPFYLMDRGFSEQDINTILQKQSGLLGLSGGLSNDMRTLVDSYETNKLAKLAIDVFCYRLRKYIGGMFAALDGCDVLVFTGGIGENSQPVRAMTCEKLSNFGIELDLELNARTRATETMISKPDKPVKVYVIPTNEELEIAQETRRLTESVIVD